jgi:hypothetical protein
VLPVDRESNEIYAHRHEWQRMQHTSTADGEKKRSETNPEGSDDGRVTGDPNNLSATTHSAQFRIPTVSRTK